MGPLPKSDVIKSQPLYNQQGQFNLPPPLAAFIWMGGAYWAAKDLTGNPFSSPAAMVFYATMAIVGVGTHAEDPESLLGKELYTFYDYAALPVTLLFLGLVVNKLYGRHHN